MISTPTTLDKPFAEYVSLLRRLHRLFTDGNGDSAEADALRNEMDAPWHELTEEERGTVSGLAADLNAIRRGAVSSGKSREELLQENEPALARAYQAGEWFEVLKHLRRLAATKKPADVSYLRGRAWSKLLDDETALLFFQHASVLEPENGVIAYAAMQCLARVDFSEALRRANEVLADPDNHGAEIVVVAAIIRFRALSTMPSADANAVVEDLPRLLRPALRQMQIAHSEPQHPALFAMAIVVASCCYQQLGNLAAAREVLDEGIRMRPDDPTLRVARGMFLYGRDEAEAVCDVQRAVASGLSNWQGPS